MSQQKLYTIKQAANHLGVQYRQLLDAVNDGTIPHYKIGKSRRLLNKNEVLTLMKVQGGNNG
jgi:excisionase family DNA binding protein